MRVKPDFFDEIQKSAQEDWEVWSNPRHGNAIWQLFKQIQSPRHVLSELLQNADDAGATAAEVDVRDGIFVFQHNGEDFTARQFASVCRFGVSEKRTLHTIGFRGIGFKSTFSLGEEVRLLTSTLAVTFDKKCFTTPNWVVDGANVTGTQISVAMSDVHRERELVKSLEDWIATPVSLLFFKNLRKLRICDTTIAWSELGPGPVVGSCWMGLESNEATKYLIVRSESAPFPDEAVEEIRGERMLSDDEDPNLPPCQVEIVLGVEGRLFVVLPTGVVTKLPFACNAPFIQDPARLKLKDSETSPTNRWLLTRAGELAAKSMVAWLQREDLPVEERALSYELLPDVNRKDNSLEGACATLVEQAFESALGDKPFLLSGTGRLKPAKSCMSVPERILQVWSAPTISEIFDEEKRAPLARAVSQSNCQKLLNWGFIHSLDKQAVAERLRKVAPPKPQSWAQLLCLWSYLSTEVTRNPWHRDPKLVHLVPVQGSPNLHSAKDVARIGEKKLVHSEGDWEFLSDYLVVLNQNWPRFLAEQRRLATDSEDSNRSEEIAKAYSLLDSMGLADTSNSDSLTKPVAERFFGRKDLKLQDCIRVTQIFAAIGASVGKEFRFATRDRHLRSADHGVVADVSGHIEDLVSPDWADTHILHAGYTESFASCSKEDWERWLKSGRSGLLSGPPVGIQSSTFWGRDELKKRLHRHGYEGEVSFAYKTHSFEIQDFDFDALHWTHWGDSGEPDIYARVLELILGQDRSAWERKLTARAFQIATTGTRKPVTPEPFVANWILKLRDLPCLKDTRGFCRRPIELLRRTQETEALIGLEPFIDAQLDTEAARPLLDALGVDTEPTGPSKLIERLKALSESDSPPIEEVEKWYRRLDSLLANASTQDVLSVRKACSKDPLVYSDGHGWLRSGEVFLSANEEDVPGAPIVLSSVRSLTLWRRLEVAERPTLALAFEWLDKLPKNETLPAETLRRTRAILQRHPAAMWEQSRHWPNLMGALVPVKQLRYSLSMRSLCPWTDLFASVKSVTADLQMLSYENLDSAPFSDLPTLASSLEERADSNLSKQFETKPKAWLDTLSKDLLRVRFKDSGSTERVRRVAERLLRTQWMSGSSVESTSYLDGAPAGPARRARAIWTGFNLLVESAPLAKQAEPVARELGRAFDVPAISEAIKFCFERDPAFVSEYLAQQFEMESEASVPVEPPTPNPSIQTNQLPTGTSGPTDSEPLLPAASSLIPEASSIGDVEPHDEEPLAGREPGDPQTPDPQHPRKMPERNAQPSLVERFALKRGFQKIGQSAYADDKGLRIMRSESAAFPWEERGSDGNLVRYYLPIEKCLQTGPIEIDVSVWEICRKNPTLYALILVEPNHSPVEFQGVDLCNLLETQKLTVFPATYRLVLNQP